MNKPTVLVLTDWYAPGYKAGGPIRSCKNLIDNLGNEVDFKVLTTNTDLMEATPYEGITSNQWIEYDNTQCYYLSKENINHQTIKTLLKTTPFDIVYLNSLFSFYFTIIPLWLLRSQKNKKIILAPRGMLGKSSLSIKPLKKRLFLNIAKSINLFKDVIWQATNETEAVDIKNNIANASKVKVVPNLPKKLVVNFLSKKEKKVGTVDLFYLARISKVKNLTFALQCLQDTPPDIKINFDLWGQVDDQTYWQECQNIIKEINKRHINTTIKYHGTIEYDKVGTLIPQYHFMFMPTLNENFGHSIIESMSLGIPVIISDQTPWKQLEAKKAGWDIDLKNKEKFLAAIHEAAYQDQETYNLWSTSAHNFAKSIILDAEVISRNKDLFFNA